VTTVDPDHDEDVAEMAAMSPVWLLPGPGQSSTVAPWLPGEPPPPGHLLGTPGEAAAVLDARETAEGVYWQQIDRAVGAATGLPVVCRLWCPRCGRDRRPLGRVVEVGGGLLLLADEAVPLVTTDGDSWRTVPPSEAARVLGRRHRGTRPRGWMLDGPNTLEARLPWVRLPTNARPGVREESPHVHCGHGTRQVDPPRVAALVRSGATGLWVGVDGRTRAV